MKVKIKKWNEIDHESRFLFSKEIEKIIPEDRVYDAIKINADTYLCELKEGRKFYVDAINLIVLDENLVTFELLDDACTPEKKNKTDAGLDLKSSINYILKPGETKLFPLGIKFNFGTKFEGELAPRSSFNYKGILGHQGTIDNEYRGEVKAILTNLTNKPFEIKKGERITQMVIRERCEYELTPGKVKDNTERGSKGFGSSGK